jgi:hypothetical protein
MIEFVLQFGIIFAIIALLFYGTALLTPLWFREYSNADIELDI